MKQSTYATTQLWADLVCISCTRKAATRIAEKGKQTVIQLEPGVHPEYARRRVCQACRGPLWFTDPDTRTVLHKLPDSEIRPGPGRPKLALAAKPARPPTKYMPCVDCGKLRTNRPKDGGPRCQDCASNHLRAEGEARFRPIADLLSAAGRPMGTRELASALGCSTGVMRGLLGRARKRGAVECVDQAYRLVVTAPTATPPEAIAPARPPRRAKRSGAPRTVPCADCTHPCRNRHGLDLPRCWDCTLRRRAAGAEARHRAVLDVLARSDRPLGSKAIAARLSVQPEYVRQVIALARQRGVPIVTVGKTFRLEMAS